MGLHAVLRAVSCSARRGWNYQGRPAARRPATAGTLLGEHRVAMQVIQRMGHAHITTTRIYTDPTDR
jgi:site-specific recombinase XerD